MTTTTTTNAIIVRDAISELVAFINEANAAHCAKHFPMLKPDTFYADGGRKYIRIAQDRGNQRSVHCFVDAATGDVYKAATWKAPALNGARFNLLDPVSFSRLREVWDPYGSYLYKGAVAC